MISWFAYLVPVVKLRQKLPHTYANNRTRTRARAPFNGLAEFNGCKMTITTISDLFVLLIFFLSIDGWRCCLPEQHKVNGRKTMQAMKTKKMMMWIEFKFCTQILIHKISFNVPIQLSAVPHMQSGQVRKNASKMFCTVCLCLCSGLQNSMEFRCLTLCIS